MPLLAFYCNPTATILSDFLARNKHVDTTFSEMNKIQLCYQNYYNFKVWKVSYFIIEASFH